MIKLNLGCGWRNFGDDWVHIDGGDYPHLNSHNVHKLDYSNDTVDLIYASHLLEYFDRDEASNILKEWIRILKPGGILRIAVPNFETIAHLYLEHNLSLEKFLGPLYGKMSMGNKTVYHKTIYDYYSLKSLVERLGMKNFKRYDWEKTEHSGFDDHSQAYIPHMDKENGTLISLNVEACK